MLCPACRQIFSSCSCIIAEKNGVLSPSFEHHKSGLALEQAALEGCDLCLRVWDMLTLQRRRDLCSEGAMENTIGKITDQTAAITCQIQQFVVPGCFNFLFERKSSSGLVPNMKWSFITAPNRESETQHEERKVEDSTLSEATMSLAAEWLENCTKSHRCGLQSKLPVGQYWHPTRLIDVGSSQVETLLSVREGGDIPSNCVYTTLSHCWGTDEIFKLCRGNLAQLKVAVPAEKLTQTFRDAIFITRRLGLRYVWIDSICIIQDSEEDWIKEAALMGKVYRYSYCNIAATGVSDGRKGFFCSRDPALVRPIILQFPISVQNEKLPRRKILSRWEDSKRRKAPQNTQHEYHNFIDVDLWKRSIDDAPLNQRGWVVQERVLAPRILHFGARQLFWECHELEACETWPGGVPDVLSESRYSKNLSPFNPSISPALDMGMPLHWTMDTRNAFHIWDTVVRSYTAGRLTHRDDKLVAISGVAREMQPLMKSRYIAGLWEINLARQLLWVSSRALESSPEKRRAPSWSWSSTDSPLKTVIHWDWRGDKNQRDILIDILEAQITPLGTDPMGQIVGGRLRIRGRMIPAGLVCAESHSDSNVSKLYSLTISGRTLGDVTVFEDVEAEDLSKPVYCVPVSVSVSLPEFSLDRRTLVYGLLLCSSGGGEGEFQRFGVFMSPKGEPFVMKPGDEESSFDWRNCTQYHGRGGRDFGDTVITIV